VRLAGVPKIPDMGVREGFDSVEVWSSNAKGLSALQQWVEDRGLETSGIWYDEE
jgi:hypothetical protein